MTLYNGKTHRPKKSLTITNPTAQETLQDSPVAVPTSEPETSQIIYTLASTDFHTFSFNPYSKLFSAFIAGAGRNTDASSRTLYWRVLKNGASVATGNVSVSTNRYYTISYYNLPNVVVGDVIELRLWASGANVDYRWQGLAMFCSQVKTSSLKNIIQKVAIAASVFPVFTQGTPAVNATQALQVYNGDTPNLITGNANLDCSAHDSTYGLFRVNYGDVTQSYSQLTAISSYPYYVQNYAPTSISFAPTLIKVL